VRGNGRGCSLGSRPVDSKAQLKPKTAGHVMSYNPFVLYYYSKATSIVYDNGQVPVFVTSSTEPYR